MQLSSPERRWVVLLLAHTLLLQVLVMLLRIAMAYDAVAIGLDTFRIGLLGSAFGLAPALLALHTGHAIDRIGEKSVLIASAMLALVSSAGLWLLPPSVAGLLILNVLAGLTHFLGVAGEHAGAARAGAGRQAASIGHVTMMISIAHMIGPTLFGMIATRGPVPQTGPVYLVAMLMGLPLLLVSGAIRIPAGPARPAPKGMLDTVGAILRTPGYATAVIASLVLFSAMDLLVVYLPLLGTELAISAATVGMLLTLRGAASVLARVFFSRLLESFGRLPLLVLSLLASGVAIGLLPVAPGVPAMCAAIFVTGLGLGIGAPLTMAWIAEIVPGERVGSALSLRLAINRVGQAVLPVAVGAVAAGFGAAAILVAIGGSLILSGGMSAYFGRQQK